MPKRLEHKTKETSYQRTCLICGQPFFVVRGRGNKPKFCGINCKQKAYRNRQRKKITILKDDTITIESDIIRLAKAHAKSQNLDLKFVIERLLARWLNNDIRSLRVKGD